MFPSLFIDSEDRAGLVVWFVFRDGGDIMTSFNVYSLGSFRVPPMKVSMNKNENWLCGLLT